MALIIHADIFDNALLTRHDLLTSKDYTMLYEQSKEIKIMCAPFEDHPLHSWLLTASRSVTFTITQLLMEADTLIFQRHPGASIKVLLLMLRNVISLTDIDTYNAYIKIYKHYKSQKDWQEHTVLNNIYTYLSK